MKHTDPDMMKMFKGLASIFTKHSPHTVTLGRKTQHEIQDLMDKGKEMMDKAAQGESENDGGDVEVDEGNTRTDLTELEDVLIELM